VERRLDHLELGGADEYLQQYLEPRGPELDAGDASFRTRKNPAIGSLVLRASLKTIRARYLLPTETARRIRPESPS
jgi:hypothetical protein